MTRLEDNRLDEELCDIRKLKIHSLKKNLCFTNFIQQSLSCKINKSEPMLASELTKSMLGTF